MPGRDRNSVRGRQGDGDRGCLRPSCDSTGVHGEPRRAIAARRSLAAVCVVLGGLLLSSAPALALSERGHTFSFVFGEGGSGAGQFSTPTAVAVNETSGDAYVLDSGNGRIERFSCTASSCTFLPQPALIPFKVVGAESIAVDNSKSPSTGDVYVATEEHVIHKYNAEGKALATIKGFKEEAGAPLEEFGEIHGIAVDAAGNVYVYRESSIVELKGSKFVKNILLALTCEAQPGLAVAPGGEPLYVGTFRENTFGACEETVPVIAKVNGAGETVSSAVDREETTAAAVDLSTGDAYLDNGTSVAGFSATGSLIQRFGSEHLTHGRGLAVDSKAGAVYVADAPANRVAVFGPEPAGPPTVDGLSSQNLTPTSERLNAQVDPHGADTHAYFQYGTVDCSATPASCTTVPAAPGKDLGSGFGDVTMSEPVEGLQPGTTYYFRLVATNDCGTGGTCTVESKGILNTLPTSAGLLPDNRAWEMVSPPEKGGAGIEAIGGVTANGGPTGGIMQAAEDGNSVTYVANAPVVPEPEGSRSPEGTQVYSTRGPEGWSTQDIVTPHNKAEGYPSGQPQEYRYFSADLSRSLVQPFGFHKLQEPPLMLGLESEQRGLYIRNNATCKSTPATCYQALVTTENDLQNKEFGGALQFLSATPDLSHVVFRSRVGLTPESLAEGGLYESESGKPLQLLSVLPNGKPAEGVPAEETGPELGFGTGTGALNFRHAISSDGSRVFWASTAEPGHLYMRDVTGKKTVQLNVPFKALSEEETELEETQFQTASSDGSKVFFTDTAPLTKDSTLHQTVANGPADLYEFDTNSGVLTDLTAASSSGPADVQGTVMGAGEDGSYVYFVANGVLASGAQLGNCATGIHGRACSLYVAHYNSEAKKWETTFIAALSSDDEPDWLSSSAVQLRRLTSRVSPNGHFLAFMSDRPLTGYENVDASSGARDEEVFLYDAAAAHLVCVSCKTGGPPHGVFDTEHSGEGNGLLVDRGQIWSGHWLAGSIPGWTPINEVIAPYQSRYLSDQGRLFFNSPEALVEKDTNGKEDVYQYEPMGVGNCEHGPGCVALISSGTSKQESAFIDATPSGNDVFFITDQQLVASDRDNAYDLYDARVCTEASPCITAKPPPPPPCSNEESCRPPSSPQTGFGAPTSATFSGPGNVGSVETLGEKNTKPPHKLTSAQKLANALKACRHKYKGKAKHRRRAACEKQAERKYGKKAAKHAKKGRR
jgi:DNA-binding beta-propeller fold protein YncE